MRQAEIMQTLKEASLLGIAARNSRGKPRWRIPDDHPVMDILQKLRESRFHLQDPAQDALIGEMLNILYTDTVVYNPEDLPSLFPFFSLACSERASAVRWPLIDWLEMGRPH